MRDFTLRTFHFFCWQFSRSGYRFVPFVDYLSSNISGKFIIMRHDVDKRPNAALAMALVEQKLGIKSSYYFRSAAPIHDRDIIREIAMMGHEIGYHYEDLVLARGNYDRAIVSFKENISRFRDICDIRTVCMHGSPLSKWDNRMLWHQCEYRDYGIIGEPYFDIDFDEVLYLTDTGRRWNSADYNIRDKVKSRFNCNFRSTMEIIAALETERIPDRVLLNTHPHRWNDRFLLWLSELFWQNTKNIGKRFLRVREQLLKGTSIQ